MKNILNKIKKYFYRSTVRKNSKPVRWGIMGLGYMGNIFSEAIDGNKNGLVAAVASRNIKKAKKFAKKFKNCKAYGNYNDMLNDEDLKIDVIYIATPTKYHFEHIKMCLKAKKNVLCEKPITLSSNELLELRKLAEKNNCFIIEGMWMKCLPTYQKALSWVKEGKIGNLEFIKTDFYKMKNFKINNYNGVLTDYGIYSLAFPIGFFSKRPDEIRYFNRTLQDKIDTDWFIYMRFDKVKVFSNISSNFNSLSKAIVIGEKGSIEWDSPFNRTNRIKLYNSDGILEEEFVVKYHFEGFEYEIDEVQNMIKSEVKNSSIISLEDSYLVLEIMDYLLKKEVI